MDTIDNEQKASLPIAIVVGAGSTIAQSLIERWVTAKQYKIIAISRKIDGLVANKDISYITSDYSENDIERIIKELESYKGQIARVIIANGILHGDSFMPEKALQEVTQENLQHVISTNTITPFIWLTRLAPILRGKQECKVAVFSARIGSISDNGLGGWYSYRASKAGLNMLLKTSAIELARRSKNIKLMAFHPGTTDTPLSKPFQKRVPKDKLFEPSFVAQKLDEILNELPIDGELSYLDWNNKKIDW